MVKSFMRRRRALSIGLAWAGIVMAGPVQAEEGVAIGVFVPETGVFAPIGQDMRQGY